MSGLTLDEVSKDLEIPVLSLEQIEDGNIGAFKDIFVLKDYLERYLPTYFSNEYKFYSYNETLKYSLKHSIL